MTDRGLPIVDGAPACPFVAFEDDRDERATSPDHRHRCYAEVRPAPRALAHQEAYCLSSAFPVCPTFQDWARREAAQTRGPRGATPPVPPTPQRNPPRDWTAPPPWHEEVEDAGRTDERGAGAIGAGLAGAAGGAATGGLAAGGAAAAAPTPEDGDAAAPDFLAGRETGRAAPGQGLAGSPADRAASALRPADAAPGPASAGPSAYDGRVDDRYDAGDASDEEADERDDAFEADDVGRRGAAQSPADRRPLVPRGRARESEMHGPAWERPRRYEAYPTIRTRMGMPQLPRVALMAAALVVAALALFFLPALLGVGSDDRATATPSPSTSVAPSVSAEPTPTPAPTPVVYVVASGDTMSSIAARFGVTLDALIEANRETVPNPDQLDIGDQLIIPVAPAAPSSAPGSEAPAGSAAAP